MGSKENGMKFARFIKGAALSAVLCLPADLARARDDLEADLNPTITGEGMTQDEIKTFELATQPGGADQMVKRNIYIAKKLCNPFVVKSAENRRVYYTYGTTMGPRKGSVVVTYTSIECRSNKK